MFDDLLDQHQAILQAADNLHAAVKSAPRTRFDEISRLSDRLSTLIKLHQQDEEVLIFTPMLRCQGMIGSPGIRSALASVQQSKSHYSEQVRHWSEAAALADWAGFTTDIGLRVRALHEQIRVEETTFFPTVMAIAA